MSNIKNVLLIALGMGFCLLVLTGFTFFDYRNKPTELGSSNQLQVSANNTDTQTVVEISGAINKPGVYHIDQSKRLIDIVELAKGISKDADHTWIAQNINMAQELSDGNKYYFPYEWETKYYCNIELEVSKNFALTNDANSQSETKILTTNTNSENLININLDSIDRIKELKGIGNAYGNKIISNRPYDNIDQFISKSGIPQATISKIQDQIIF